MIISATMDLAVRSPSASRLGQASALASWALPDLAAVASFAGLTALFYWRILTTNPLNQASFPDGDFTGMFFPFALHRANELMAGRLPTWSPYHYGGHPFVADMQAAVYYPLAWLTMILAGPGGFSMYTLEVEAIAHVFLAAVFTYALGRRLFANRFAAGVAALVFAFGGYLIGYPVLQVTILEAQVWFPLILLGLHAATSAPPRSRISLDGRLAWGLGTGFVLGIALLAGHPQAAMYVVYGAAAFWLFRLWCLGIDHGHQVAWRVALATGTFLPVGLALASAQLVPTAEFMQLSSRAEVSYDFLSGGFPLHDWIQLILPGVVSHFSPMYVGILPLTLVVLAIVAARTREVTFWAGLAGFALLLSFGRWTIVYSALYLLAPGFSTFRQQERAAFLLTFALAILAGYGARHLARTAPSSDVWPRFRRGLLWAAGGAGLLTVFLQVGASAGLKLGELLQATGFLTLLCLFAALVYALKGQGVRPAVLHTLALGGIAVNLLTVSGETNVVRGSPSSFFPDSPFMRQLQSYARETGTRIYNNLQLHWNYGLVYQVQEVRGASPLVVKRYRELLDLPWERIWELMYVGQFIHWENKLNLGTLVAQQRTTGDKHMYLFTLPEPPPRARIVHGARLAPTDAEALDILRQPSFDPATEVVLPGPPPIVLDGIPAASSRARLVDEQATRLVIEAELEKPGLLVLSEVWYPGWKARVGERQLEVLRANHALRAIPLEAGRHRVEIAFEPDTVYAGIALSLATLALLVLALGALAVRRGRQKPSGEYSGK